MNALLAAAAVALPIASPPMVLPGSGARSAGDSTWIVGARPGAASLAARFGARPLGGNAYALPRGRAREFAAGLRERGLLFYAQPDVPRSRASSPEAQPEGWARGAVVSPTLVPPSPTAAPIAVIDDFVDTTLPDLAGHVGFLNGSASSVIEGPHGTMVAGAASAAANGQGLLGVLPGNTILSGGVPTKFSCADTTPLIFEAIRAKARVINMSYGSTTRCFAEYVALQAALSQGILAVAASGNEFARGNPVTFPAALPHVLSVAAVNRQLESSYFSTSNAAVDIAAPGSDVPLNIPLAFDTEDGAQDGYTTADGTSFAAPIAAGAAAWILSARPGITGAQAADLLRRTAVDVGKPGYDVDTGYGLVNVDRAMAQPTPMADPREPNDGLEWVDGRAFGKPDRFVWTGGRASGFAASVDQIEDPVDVYRFKVPARSRVRLTVTPQAGDPGILVYRSGTKSFDQTSRIIAGSSKPGGSAERVSLANRSSRAQWAFAAILNDTSAKVLDVRYRLAFRRLS